jgi:4-hydroxybenzoate polyprenyltransferase
MGLVRSLVRLVRPKQWAKNLLVFAALIFAARFGDPHSLGLAVAAFVAMSLVSSATYVFNDLADVERDRLHPIKRNRPIASGAVAPPVAVALGLVLFFVGIGIAAWLGVNSLTLVVAYLLLQVLYNGWLKRQPVADVYCIATGFVLRAVLGAAAIRVDISGWLLFCTGALALMLGFGKRRHEFILQGDQRATTRESLVSYNRLALDGMVVMYATAAALCYGVYSIESRTAERFPAIILTAPFVFYGITRYVLLIFTADEGGEPADVLFRDRHLLVTIFFFLATALLAMSGFHLPLLER